MKSSIIILFAIFCFLSCRNTNKKLAKNITTNNGIECTESKCYGIYIGPEFINGDDIAHQFSNKMSGIVGNKLKEFYRNGKFKKVDFSNVFMSTTGMGTGIVEYELSIPFISVKQKCEAFTSFDHVGGWNHKPNLSKRKRELQEVLMKGQKLNISSLKSTSEGLQEYWIQWKNKKTQAECK